MGIKSINKFLRKICPEIFETIHISEYAYKKVAIDISLYLCKYKAIAGDDWLKCFINLIACLRKNEVHTVFIFDGPAPPEKQLEQEKRRLHKEQLRVKVKELENSLEIYYKTDEINENLKNLYARRKFSKSPCRLLGARSNKIDFEWLKDKIQQKRNQIIDIKPEDYTLAKDLFTLLKVPFFTAPSEAEKMCSKLCISNIVDAVLSEDTDILAYGSPVFLSKINTRNDTCTRINHSVMLTKLQLTKESFLDLCIMSGCDYNSNIPRIGNHKAYKYLIKFENIENIENNTNLDISILNHKRVRELFTKFTKYTFSNVLYCGKPKLEKLQNFINKQKIYINFEKVKECFFKNNLIIFEDSEEEEEEEPF